MGSGWERGFGSQPAGENQQLHKRGRNVRLSSANRKKGGRGGGTLNCRGEANTRNERKDCAKGGKSEKTCCVGPPAWALPRIT